LNIYPPPAGRVYHYPGAHTISLAFLYERKSLREACAQFRRYAKLASSADDAERIRDYVLELERDGDCR